MANKRIKDWATTITAFRSGDVIPVDGSSGSAKMAKNDLLKETAQNALAGNVAKEFDPTRVSGNKYGIGEFVSKDGKTYQFIKPHYGAWNASDVINVPSDDVVNVSPNTFGKKTIHLVGEGTTLLRTPLIPVVPGEVVTISVSANWDASTNTGNKNKFALNYYSDNEYTRIAVLNNDTVNSTYTWVIANGVKFISFVARGDAGESIEFSYELGEAGFVDSKLFAFPYKINNTFTVNGNDSLARFNLYRCGANKFVRFKFTADWADVNVTYNKFYIQEVLSDGTTSDSLFFIAHEPIPLNLKYKTSKNCVSLVVGIRGDSGESVVCNVSVEEIQQKHKIASTAVWRGDVELNAGYKPAFRNNNVKSRFEALGYRCIPLKAGDTIWCEDGYRFYTASSADGSPTFTIKGWITSSGYFVAKTDCYVYVNFASVGDAEIKDIADAVQAFTILTDGDTGISPVSEAINSMRLHRAHVLGVNHRGFNKIAPENTMPAFKMSRYYGFKYVETDLQYSADDVPVLIHDTTVDRTSDGTGNVADMTIAQLKALDFGSWKDASYAGTKIPTLEEFLDFVSTTGMEVFLEVKAGTFSKFESLALPLIVKRGLLDKFHIINFSTSFIEDANNSLKNAKLGILCGNDISSSVTFLDGLSKDNGNLLFVDTSDSAVLSTPAGQACPYPIATWTVDSSTVLLTQTPYYAVTSDFHDVSQELFAQSIAAIPSDIR